MFRFSALLLTILLLLVPSAVVVAQQSVLKEIPEKNGDYPDHEHPGVRVRVFVHEPKGHRPTPTPSPLICTDPDSNATVGPTGWKLPPDTWRYNLNLSSVPSSVGSDNLALIANESFTAWINAIAGSSSKPTIIRGADATKTKSAYDGQNIIAWGRTSGTALAVTYTRYYTSTRLVVDVDTIMNQKFPWSWTPYDSGVCGLINTYDVQDILTHELGHWFGLDDHYTSPYIDNTMYGYGTKAEIKKDTLTSGDISGIQTLYPFGFDF